MENENRNTHGEFILVFTDDGFITPMTEEQYESFLEDRDICR